MRVESPRAAVVSLMGVAGYLTVRVLGDFSWLDAGFALLAINFTIHCLEPPGQEYPRTLPFEIPFAIALGALTLLLYLADSKVGFAFVLLVLVVGTSYHAVVVLKNHRLSQRIR